MAVRTILRWPDPRLSLECAPVETFTREMRALVADMFETMYAASGRGLAGPQIGAMHRVFVMDAGWKEGMPEPQAFLNPTITYRSQERATAAEGCLSIPGIMAFVTRPSAIRLRWQGLDGTTYVAPFDGFGATCVQHENDHLDGVLTLDHLTAEARAEVLAICMP